MHTHMLLTAALALPMAFNAHAENVYVPPHEIQTTAEQHQADEVHLEQTRNLEGVHIEFTAVQDIWARIRAGYELQPLESSLTAKHEAWYASRPEYMARMIARSERYLHYIVEEVEKRDMPSEIALLPMIESGFNPQALSRSRAAGIWQFMPVTGKNFGLDQNWWVDHRKNVTAATQAALDYLQKLHLMFGSWDLALAAYNAGEGTVSRAIEKNRKQGLPTNYQSLPLSDETKNYVPKLQAMKNLITHPERYGLIIEPIANQPYFTKVTAPEQIDAELAASLAEIPYEEFAALNPEYNRPVLTSTNDRVHEILLPIHAADVFQHNLAHYEQPLVTWKTYEAKRGEHIDQIAKKFDITPVELRQANSLPSIKSLNSGRLILVPATHSLEESTRETASIDSKVINAAMPTELHTKPSLSYEVTKNDTLYSIALRYGITVKALMEHNQLKSSRLKVGQILIIPAGNKPTMQKQAANTSRERS